MRSVLVALIAGIGACGHAQPKPPAWPDAPLELRDDSDRDQAIDELWVLPLGPQRDAVRADVVAAIARRITDALEEDKPFVAETLLVQLASLWQRDPGELGRGLAGQADLLHKLRGTFAKSGAIEPTITCVVMLAEIEPTQRTAHAAELDEILGFADELAAAENGPEAQRAQPIALLQPTALVLPLPALVDRYVALLEERQRAVSALIQQQGASMQLVRAHGDILLTGHRIANTLARAGRADEIRAHLGTGLGFEDRELAARAEALGEHPTADAYLELARSLRADEKAPDPAAALAVDLAGIGKFPKDSVLLTAAAEDSAKLGRVDQPIELYEAALQTAGGDVDNAVAMRLGKLYSERIARLAFGGRPRAATTAWHDLARFTDRAAQRAPTQVWAQVAAIAETALGRGYLSQGWIDDAEHVLVASIDRAPSIDAYETLATIHYKTDRLASATRYATAGLALLGDTKGDLYRRAKLERLAGDVMRTAGKPRDAASFYLDAMRSWAALGPDKELARPIVAERKLEFGRGLWFLGETGRAIDLVLEAIDVDPDAAATVAGAASFLIQIGRPIDALDAVHRALSSSGVNEFYKVYMCLWVLADAHRRGEPHDRQAYDYLSGRHGELWYEQLAEAATGRRELAALSAAATTGPRRAELAFYGVVLGLDPEARTREAARKKLAEVVEARLVMDAEYDLARQYLAQP